jgi:hypothetical protein
VLAASATCATPRSTSTNFDIDIVIQPLANELPVMLQAKVSVSGTEAGLSHLRRNGVDFVFVSHPAYMRQGLYSDTKGVYGDNQVSSREPPTLLCVSCSCLYTRNQR